MSVSDNDRVLLSRFVDGDLGDLERRALEVRLQRERELQSELDELEASRAWFGRATAGEPLVRPTPGFAERLMGEVRRLPDPEVLASAEQQAVADVQVFARRLMLAALVVLGAAIVFSASLWTAQDAAEIEASPTEIQRVIEQIDRAIESGRADQGPVVIDRDGQEGGR